MKNSFEQTCRWLMDTRAMIAVVIAAVLLLMGGGRAVGRIEARLATLELGQQEIRGLLLAHIQGYQGAPASTPVVNRTPRLVSTAWAKEATNEEVVPEAR